MSKSYTCIYDVIDDESFRSVQDEYIETGAKIYDALCLYILPPNNTINATVTLSNNELSPLKLAIRNIPSDDNIFALVNCSYTITDDTGNDIYNANYGSNVSLLSTDYNLYNNDTLTIVDDKTYVQFDGPTFYFQNRFFPLTSINGEGICIKNEYNYFYTYTDYYNPIVYNNIFTLATDDDPIYIPQYETIENNVLHINYTNDTSNANILVLYNDWTTGLPANTRVTVQKTITENNKAITSFYYANNTITIPSSNYTRIELIPYTDGTNYTCSLETGTLPEGLELLSTGVIRNTENVSSIQSGVYNITVVCDNGSSSMSYSLTINVIDNYLGYEPVYKFTTNNNITITPVNTYTGVYLSDNLPTGLSIENGVITGRITTSFNDNIKVNYSENNVVNNASNIIESYNTFNLIVSNVIIKNIVILC